MSSHDNNSIHECETTLSGDVTKGEDMRESDGSASPSQFYRVIPAREYDASKGDRWIPKESRWIGGHIDDYICVRPVPPPEGLATASVPLAEIVEKEFYQLCKDVETDGPPFDQYETGCVKVAFLRACEQAIAVHSDKVYPELTAQIESLRRQLEGSDRRLANALEQIRQLESEDIRTKTRLQQAEADKERLDNVTGTFTFIDTAIDEARKK